MNEAKQFEIAYDAHEKAEAAAGEAMMAVLREQSVEALAVLCDPEWRWETRSWMSEWIIEWANEVLNEKLDALVA